MLDQAFVRTAREAPLLTSDVERGLIIRAQAGDQRARDRLFASHYRLVITEAAKRQGYKIPIADMVQEGIAGMSEALNRFDPAQDVRFNTYARWWICSAMNDAALRDHSVVRRNTTQTDKSLFFSLRKARNLLESGGKLTEGEINVQLADRFNTTVAEIVSMTAYLVQGDRALDAPAGNFRDEAGGSVHAIDLLVDTAPRPDEIVEARIDGGLLQQAIANALSKLDERERRIVTARRYPADPDETLTLEDLGIELDLSRERVRQIEERALRKLAHFLRADGIGPRNI